MRAIDMSEDPNVEPGSGYGTPSDGTPPGWPDGAPSPTSSADVPPTGPLPLGEAIRQLPNQYIRVLTRPGAAVFAQEQNKAAWNITWVQILISSVVAVLVGLVEVNTAVPASLANSHVPIQIIQLIRTFSGAFALSYIVLTPIFFFIGMGLYYLFAKAFGGKGMFLTYCYCSILYGVPLGIVSGILSIIVSLLGLPSLVSSLLAGILGIYGIVLQVFVTMGVHRLSGGKATLAVILVPIILFVLVFVLFFVGIFVFIAGHPR
jgi:hypothetical protein